MTPLLMLIDALYLPPETIVAVTHRYHIPVERKKWWMYMHQSCVQDPEAWEALRRSMVANAWLGVCDVVVFDLNEASAEFKTIDKCRGCSMPILLVPGVRYDRHAD